MKNIDSRNGRLTLLVGLDYSTTRLGSCSLFANTQSPMNSGSIARTAIVTASRPTR